MSKVHIVIEGEDDKEFLSALLEYLNIEAEINFIQIKTNGRSISSKIVRRIFTETVNLSEKTLFILDADSNEGSEEAGFKVTRDSILKSFEGKLNEDSVFLFPNDKGDGCLENLLLEIASQSSKEIFECFENYKACIHKIDERYVKPDLKTKVYAYSEIRTGSGRSKDRNYLDTNIWVLNHPVLNPLEEFLRRHLS